MASTALQADDEIRKSPNDHREYRSLTLDNRMRVLLISDVETSEAAAALAVRVGSGDDPEDRPGLAHYLEHMLFLGTEKYPELDDYRAFIEQNGGNSNASTSIDLTNYSFSVDADYLKPALDRFAQFFISPLFPEQQLDRERAVVHAEYEMRTQRDGVRRWAALRHAYNPAHPSSKFASGTSETLAGDIRDDLIKFYRQRYSANLMNLVVLGRDNLDVLERWVREMFSTVPDVNASQLEVTEPLFLPGSLPALLEVKTLKNEPTLTLYFPIQNLQPYWREDPQGYIANLLGHEGEGSLLSELKGKGWADGLYASAGNSGITTYTFTVGISLTQQGLNNWKSAVAYVFQYIRKIQEQGVEQWRFEEQKKLYEINFLFSEVENPRGLVGFLAGELHKYPSEEILTAHYLLDRFDPELITSILNRLVPENVLVMLESNHANTTQTTPYIGAEYSLSAVSEMTIENWQRDIADSSNWLPQPNEFLPDDFSLVVAENMTKPVSIASEPGLSLWYQNDTSFEVPRASFFFSVRSPAVKEGVRQNVLHSLYIEAVNDQLTEFAYPALLAGLNYSLYSHSRGFSTRINGYSHNQSAMLRRILSTLVDLRIDEKKFNVLRERQIREIQNNRRDSAYRQAVSEFYKALLIPSYSDEERLQVLRSISVDDLAVFSRQLLKKINIVALSHGNVDRQHSKQLGAMLASALLDSNFGTNVRKSDVVVLPDDGPFVRDIKLKHEDSAIAVYIQGEDRSVAEKAQFSLLAQIIQTPFFSELRSVQKTGYVVFSYYIPLNEVPGLMFVIQSPDTAPDEMRTRIDEFLNEFHTWLAALSDEMFDAYREGLVGVLLEKDNTLQERSERYWQAIDRKDHTFELHEQVADYIETLDRKQFQEFVKNILIDGHDRRLIVQGYGQRHDIAPQKVEAAGYKIVDINKFKSKLERFPQL